MNILQPIPPGGDVVIESSQPDIFFNVVTLVVAALAVGVSAWVAYYSQQQAGKQWLRTQRREAYAEFIAITTQQYRTLADLHVSYAAYEAPCRNQEDVEEEYAELTSRELLAIATLDVLASRKLYELAETYQDKKRKLYHEIAQPDFGSKQKDLKAAMLAVREQMSIELGVSRKGATTGEGK
ncbi:Tfp pilus assembly protein PilE [Pseudoclavibacter sp. JAI123]|uniref:hypothetical protein n=1 Tax=Pseudoclavibacter sp. JAI123 TaxID=2723065 RepID=UPI0015CE1DCB|nr:hypothetical protein [Pseudoclavibacter sp. JAI123]NYF13622.1 Tfp pilus assembly protein PilE [Pseudoclavibacter sp. JAI123]